MTDDHLEPLHTSRWWETAAGITRPRLKVSGWTLADLIGDLDEIQRLGFDGVEVFAPYEGGVAYWGLDALDFCSIDPAIGTMDDYLTLVREAHGRGIAIIPFLNLGYVHEEYPAFLRACDDIAAGRTTADTRLFLWSTDATVGVGPEPDEHFLQDNDGRWEFSERAGQYYWVKWMGDDGTMALPQLNWADPGWRREAGEVIDFWLATGADGVVVDAVNWYVGCDWPTAKSTMAARVPAGVFTHPEGAGGFSDDPVRWIVDGGFTMLMDYGLKVWWDDLDVVRDAVLSGDPAPIEAALRSFRDPVVEAGGTCFINPPRMSSHPPALQRLASAVVATAGELYFDAFGIQTMTDEHKQIVQEMLHLRREHPELTANGSRASVATPDPSVWAFIRSSGSGHVLVVLNFASTSSVVQLALPEGHATVDGSPTVELSLTGHDVTVLRLRRSPVHSS